MSDTNALLDAIEIPVANIRRNPRNPRRKVLDGPGGAASVAEMVRSLLAEGLHEPVLVRLLEDTPIGGKFYELVGGERRWRAFRQMGKDTIPSRVLEASEAEAAMKCLVLFLQAKGTSPMEEAVGYRDALELKGVDGRPVFTVEQVAERTGNTVERVRRMALLCDLPEDAQSALMRGLLTESSAWLIARLPDAKAREELAAEALRLELTVQGIKSLTEERYMRDLRGAPFNRTDAELVAEAGSCEVCPHRTGANVARFGECKGGAAWMCTMPDCFRGKVEAGRRATVAKLEKEGLKVLSTEECDREFPAGMKVLRFNSDFVRVGDPVPPDLLKSEVAAHHELTWAELLEKAKDQPQRFAGFNQDGVVEVLVKRQDAITAIDKRADRHVFRESDKQAARPGAAAVAAPAEPPVKPAKGKAAAVAEPEEKEDPAAVAVSLELATANGLLVEIDAYLRQREIKLSAQLRIRLEAYLERQGLAEKEGKK